MTISNYNPIWLWRVITSLLVIFIFINRVDVIEQYNKSSWWSLLLVTLGCWIIVEWGLHRLEIPTVSRYVLIITAGIALYSDTFGTMADLYQTYHWYDRVLHFTVTAIVTLWLWHIFKIMIKVPLKWYMWIIFTTAVFIGNIWEFIEFAADIFFVDGHYWIAAAPDTVEDILFDALGASLAVFSMGWIDREYFRP